MFRRLAMAALGFGVVLGGAVAAQTHPHGAPQHGEQAEVAEDGSVTINLQGDASEWWSNPYNYAFYGAAVMAFANGAEEVDAEALDKAFMLIAADFAEYMGADPVAMQDHLKLITEQTIEIVTEDPSVLDSYEDMMLAMRGPD